MCYYRWRKGCLIGHCHIGAGSGNQVMRADGCQQVAFACFNCCFVLHCFEGRAHVCKTCRGELGRPRCFADLPGPDQPANLPQPLMIPTSLTFTS